MEVPLTNMMGEIGTHNSGRSGCEGGEVCNSRSVWRCEGGEIGAHNSSGSGCEGGEKVFNCGRVCVEV